MPPLLPHENNRNWINFIVGQVVRQQLMELSDVMTVWDGSPAMYPVRYPFVEQYAAVESNEGWNTLEMPDQHLKQLPANLFVGINVWRNWDTVCLHWERCHAFRCNDPDKNKDFLLFSNVEVKLTPDDMLPEQDRGRGFVDLTLRSGQHRGKSVRVVYKQSILGKLFRQKLDAVIHALHGEDTGPSSQTMSSSVIAESLVRTSPTATPRRTPTSTPTNSSPLRSKRTPRPVKRFI